MFILLHSSKTMRSTVDTDAGSYQKPHFLDEAQTLMSALKRYTKKDIVTIMKVSDQVADKTSRQADTWSTDQNDQLPAIDAFLGDIYSGLQTATLTDDDRQYANDHLYILSGLYGVLRALDSICSYRLEMGYKLKAPFENLPKYWNQKIVSKLPDDKLIINLSAAEYTKAILPLLHDRTIVSPKFLSMNPKTNEPVFVVVHAKIARGAFAHWLIKNRIDSVEAIRDFDELGYVYDRQQSTENEPVFIANEFKGLGLSVRLT